MGIDFRQGKRSSHLKAIFELRLEQSEETSVQITEKEHFRPRELLSKCPRSSMEGWAGARVLGGRASAGGDNGASSCKPWGLLVELGFPLNNGAYWRNGVTNVFSKAYLAAVWRTDHRGTKQCWVAG